MGAVLDDAVGQHDARVIARHRAGDRSAFSDLYDAYYDQLLRYVRKNVREVDMVEDITQEAFARAFAALDRLRDPARFYPWLRVIARRLVIDHYRLRVRVTAVADLDPGQAEAADGELLERLLHADVAAALLRVNPRHLEILRMREIEGYSYEQIAEKLDVPATTVPPLLWRARAALRREYLKVTEQERSWLVLPGLYLVLDAVRRVRDRAMQVAAYLPDPHAITGSVAAVAISVAALVPGTPHDIREGTGAGEISGMSDVTAALVAHTSRASTHPAGGAGVEGADPAAGGVAGFPGVVLGGRAVHEGREHDRRRKPIFVETPHGSIGADPQAVRRDIESSLAGDHEWMEGRCASVQLGCS